MQVEKAREKKREFKEMELIKTKNKKITEMFMSIPKTETKRIEDELREMKANLWRKWRGKNKVMENKVRIPTEMEKLDRKIEEIEKKIKVYNERKNDQIKKKNKKQKEWWDKKKMIVKDTWGMMTWLSG